MNDRHARRLFLSGALFNWSVAAGLLFLWPLISALMALTPPAGTNLSFVYLASALIAAFGYAYYRAAFDPQKYRPCIELGAIAKLMVFAAVTVPWLRGLAGWQLPALASADVVYSVLFIRFLRGTDAVAVADGHAGR